MIPDIHQCFALWEKYRLPPMKRIHVEYVSKVAYFLACEYQRKGKHCHIPLVVAASLLHDIDKTVPKIRNEDHPDTAVRILKSEGMIEVARLVRTHSLHTIVDEGHPIKTLEARILFLSDKMVKYRVMTVDERFDLWRNEHIPKSGMEMLVRAYPKVKELEKAVFTDIGLDPQDVAKRIT